MQTIITKTSSKGNMIEIVSKDFGIYGYVDGQTAGSDSVETYPKPVQVGAVTVAGYLRKSKIALTPDELFVVKAQIKANQSARKASWRTSPIERNQPTDLGAEMDREDSAW